MIKVCWISNIPSPYKVELMNLLSSEWDITALFESEKASDREDSWFNYDFHNYKVIYLAKDYKKIIKECANNCDVLINADYSNKICIYATNEFKKQKKPVILQADGGLAVNRGLFNYVISYVMKKCDYFLSSGKEVNKYFNYYKIDDSKIFNYRFSSLNEADLIKNKELLTQKAILRKELGIKENKILFSVGQQIPRKGYDILAKAMINVSKDVVVYIAGGYPEEKVKKIIEENKLKNIHFIGFKNKNELSKYYAASDIFVLPTRYDIWGLVINEAMSFGLPIISSDRCVAAVEFNNLFNNALIVENENIDELSKSINKLIDDNNLMEKLGNNSLNGIENYTIENTKEDFKRIINEILEK